MRGNSVGIPRESFTLFQGLIGHLDNSLSFQRAGKQPNMGTMKIFCIIKGRDHRTQEENHTVK